MAKSKRKPTGEIYEGEEYEATPVITQKPKKQIKYSDEYTRGISKIASYSGTIRRMKIKDGKMMKDGKWDESPFDEIINIYVNPNGEIIDYNRMSFKNTMRDNPSISKKSVRAYGESDKALWAKAEKSGSVTSRRKKPVKSKVSRSANKKPHK